MVPVALAVRGSSTKDLRVRVDVSLTGICSSRIDGVWLAKSVGGFDNVGGEN